VLLSVLRPSLCLFLAFLPELLLLFHLSLLLFQLVTARKMEDMTGYIHSGKKESMQESVQDKSHIQGSEDEGSRGT
jgi:hypothetical protein